MKILINLQVGSVRVSVLRNTLRIIRRQCCRKIYLETIEGSFPLFSVGLLGRRLTVGMCSTGIDFQLGTNAADSNGSKRVKQTSCRKRLQPEIEPALRVCSIARNWRIFPPSVGEDIFIKPRDRPAYPQA
ncbi:hypothetical protein QIW46_14870 [Pseudomonas fluorescens]|uniref:hypothetical protein n=1 Tax=Pseudomonas fluorescens TaxID=294 RepID=UPI003525D711